MGAKSSVKLAYKMFLASIFTSDGHAMLLVWFLTTQEDAPSEQLQQFKKQILFTVSIDDLNWHTV